MNNKGKQTKGDSKGDGKVKFQSSKGKGSQQQGGKQNPGFGQWNQTGYQQAGGKQSVQNQTADKQSDKGKGRTCYTCGRTGHLARDCWNAKEKGGCGTHSQVRSVEEGNGDAGVSSTNDATAHENSQQYPSSISQNVCRVQQPVVSDMRSADLQFDSLNLEVRALFFDMSQNVFLEEYIQSENLPNHDLREGIDLIEPCVWELANLLRFGSATLKFLIVPLVQQHACATTACGHIACMRRFHVLPLVVLIWTCMRL